MNLKYTISLRHTNTIAKTIFVLCQLCLRPHIISSTGIIITMLCGCRCCFFTGDHYYCCRGCCYFGRAQTRIRAHNEYEIWNDRVWTVGSWTVISIDLVCSICEFRLPFNVLKVKMEKKSKNLATHQSEKLCIAYFTVICLCFTGISLSTFLEWITMVTSSFSPPTEKTIQPQCMAWFGFALLCWAIFIFIYIFRIHAHIHNT